MPTIIIKMQENTDMSSNPKIFLKHTLCFSAENLRWKIDLEGLRQASGNIKEKVKHTAKRDCYLHNNNLSASLQPCLFTVIGPRGSALQHRPRSLCNEFARNGKRN